MKSKPREDPASAVEGHNGVTALTAYATASAVEGHNGATAQREEY